MKNLYLKLFVILGLGVFGLALTLTASEEQSPTYPTNPLVQFSAQGHVLGFGARELIVSNATYALRVEFVAARRGPRQVRAACQTHRQCQPDPSALHHGLPEAHASDRL